MIFFELSKNAFLRYQLSRQHKKRQRCPNTPRNPYPEVKQALRQEVRYACPIPDCGSPLLEWHHFDPKWREKHHHNPEGMIALCIQCHRKADLGTWTKEQLRAFKNNPQPVPFIRQKFAWAERSVLYKLGNCYSVDCTSGALAIRNQRILWHERTSEGRLLFSLDFFGENGQPILQVRKNSLSIDASRVWDLSINSGATHLTLWLGKRKPGIELQFHRYSLGKIHEEISKDIGERSCLFDYITKNCLDSDGAVPMIEIAKAKLYAPDRSLVEISCNVVKSTNGSQFIGCSAFNCGGFGFNL